MQTLMQCSRACVAAECSLQQPSAALQTARLCGVRGIRRPVLAMRASTQRLSRSRQQVLEIVATYPEPETEKERSPIDFPQEWITPQPSRRPDIFPEFEKLTTPLPKPMPGDPEMPDEEEEEEKEKKPDKEDPDKEEEGAPKPDQPAPSEE